jgi:hypothetical protein
LVLIANPARLSPTIHETCGLACPPEFRAAAPSRGSRSFPMTSNLTKYPPFGGNITV